MTTSKVMLYIVSSIIGATIGRCIIVELGIDVDYLSILSGALVAFGIMLILEGKK